MTNVNRRHRRAVDRLCASRRRAAPRSSFSRGWLGRLKAGLVVLTSAFYVVNFFGTRALLGWSSIDPLPPRFKLLSARDRRTAFARGRARRHPSLGRGARRRQFPERRAARLSLAVRRQAGGEDRSGDQGERRRQAARRPHGRFRQQEKAARPGDGAGGDSVDDHDDRRRRPVIGRSARSGAGGRRESGHRLYAAGSAAHARQGPAIGRAKSRRFLREDNGPADPKTGVPVARSSPAFDQLRPNERVELGPRLASIRPILCLIFMMT